MASRERTGAEDRESISTKTGKRRGESEEERRGKGERGEGESIAIAPTLGKFGVTQGDEDKSRLWMRSGVGYEEVRENGGSKARRRPSPTGVDW